MTMLAETMAVAGFQLRRMLTPQRVVIGLLGAVFPAAVLLAARRIGGQLDRNFAVLLVHALIPEAICMLGLLVTMCPAVADELERGTWAYVATRPRGRRALLLGTYVAAVAWTCGVALIAVVLALAAAGVSGGGGLAAMFGGLVLLSAVGRGALFALPAVVVPKRALVASVGVAIVVEYLAGFLPAIVNQVTVSLRLRSLLVSWMDWRRQLPVEFSMILDPNPAWVQIGAVIVLAGVLLAAAVLILERRQFPPADES